MSKVIQARNFQLQSLKSTYFFWASRPLSQSYISFPMPPQAIWSLHCVTLASTTIPTAEITLLDAVTIVKQNSAVARTPSKIFILLYISHGGTSMGHNTILFEAIILLPALLYRSVIDVAERFCTYLQALLCALILSYSRLIEKLLLSPEERWYQVLLTTNLLPKWEVLLRVVEKPPPRRQNPLGLQPFINRDSSSLETPLEDTLSWVFTGFMLSV